MRLRNLLRWRATAGGYNVPFDRMGGSYGGTLDWFVRRLVLVNTPRMRVPMTDGCHPTLQ